jgi:magnesium transporter
VSEDAAAGATRAESRRRESRDPTRVLLRHLRRRSGLVLRGRAKPPGASPGTVVHTGPRRVETVIYECFEYGDGAFREQHPADVLECFPFAPPPHITWVNVDGLHEVDRLRAIGERAGLHALVVEDVASTGQRPKVEDYDSQLYIVLRMLSYNDDHQVIEEEQLSLVLGPGFLLSFQEQPGDAFDAVRERLRNGKGSLRSRGADYLAYALIDAVVDHFFVVLEKLADRLEEVETEVIERPTPSSINRIHQLKRELLVMRKAVRPLRDVLNTMIRDDCALVTAPTRLFLRDAYDHTVQVIDTMETMRDLVSGLMDLYLSSVSNRMNEVMKVLTIIATLFIPLTFIAGIYGMNFDPDTSPMNMPELRWYWGYPFSLLLMGVTAAGLIAFFKRKGWF